MIRPPPSFTLFPYPPLFRPPTASTWGGIDVLTGGTADIPHTILRNASTGVKTETGAGATKVRRIVCRMSAVPPLRGSEEHTAEIQSRPPLACRLLLGKKKQK